MSDLTQEELELLAASVEEPKRTRAKRTEEPAPVKQRGPITPVQWVDDDGWGDLPVQMRG